MISARLDRSSPSPAVIPGVWEQKAKISILPSLWVIFDLSFCLVFGVEVVCDLLCLSQFDFFRYVVHIASQQGWLATGIIAFFLQVFHEKNQTWLPTVGPPWWSRLSVVLWCCGIGNRLMWQQTAAAGTGSVRRVWCVSRVICLRSVVCVWFVVWLQLKSKWTMMLMRHKCLVFVYCNVLEFFNQLFGIFAALASVERDGFLNICDINSGL